MNKKIWIWISLAVVVIIVIIIIYKSAKSSADKKLAEADDLEKTSDESDPSLTSDKKSCRQLCRTICKQKSFWGKGRSKCRKTCKADCTVHDIDYVKAHASEY